MKSHVKEAAGENLAVVFPGVGSQHTGMLKDFYVSSKIVRETFEEAEDLLGEKITELCFSEENKEALNELRNAQLALFVSSMAVFRLFRAETGIVPRYALGYSLGEYSALCASGGMDFKQGLELVHFRGKVIEAEILKSTGTMVWVINADYEMVQKACEEESPRSRIFVSAVDTARQCSISGENEVVYKVAASLEKAGAMIIPLKMAGPFHSPLMKTAGDKMAELLKEYTFRDLDFPLVANVCAKPYQGKESIPQNLAAQLTNKIRWLDSINYIYGEGVTTIVELGPKEVLGFLIKKIQPFGKIFSFNDYGMLQAMRKSLGVESLSPLAVMEECLKICVSTRNSNHNHTEYADMVIKPYREMQAVYMEFLGAGTEPLKVDVLKCIDTVKGILKHKNLPLGKQKAILNNLRMQINSLVWGV